MKEDGPAFFLSVLRRAGLFLGHSQDPQPLLGRLFQRPDARGWGGWTAGKEPHSDLLRPSIGSEQAPEESIPNNRADLH